MCWSFDVVFAVVLLLLIIVASLTDGVYHRVAAGQGTLD